MKLSKQTHNKKSRVVEILKIPVCGYFDKEKKVLWLIQIIVHFTFFLIIFYYFSCGRAFNTPSRGIKKKTLNVPETPEH